jgi:hypothetical protein
MSKTLEENWEFLSREHELFLQDPGYLRWLQEQQPKQEKEWDIIAPKGPDMLLL